MGEDQVVIRARSRVGEAREPGRIRAGAKPGRREKPVAAPGRVRDGGVILAAPPPPGTEGVLSPDALAFVAELEREFRGERAAVLARHEERRREIEAGRKPGFPPGTETIRRAGWRVAPVPAELEDRRVELTGPADRKTLIHGLNSGANVFVADLEDALSPTWENVTTAQANLRDAVAGTISMTNRSGREHRLVANPAVLMVRPRGWRPDEKHLLVDGHPASAALFDVGLFLFHGAAALVARGSGPRLCLPKVESREEARLWREALRFAEERLGLPDASIRVTVVVETVLGALEMDEILFELRGRAVALATGRLDYLADLIRTCGRDGGARLPDGGRLNGRAPFLQAYADLLVRTAHRRGAHALGGAADLAPNRRDAAANRRAISGALETREREVRAGFDGSRVGHPDLVPTAAAVFERWLDGAAHQKHVTRDDAWITADDLLDFRVAGDEATGGARYREIEIALRYLAGWLTGVGATVVRGRMTDAASAELAARQVWQWVHLDGDALAPERVRARIAEAFGGIEPEARKDGTTDALRVAADLLERFVTDPDPAPSLIAAAYQLLE